MSAMHPKFSAMLRRSRSKYLVEFDRRPKIKERITGFVLDFNEALVLLHRLDWDTFSLNGYIVMRMKDVRKARAFEKRSYWQNKAVRRKKLKPSDPGISIASIEELFTSSNKAFPLIAIQTELADDSVCWIGKLAKLTTKTVTVHNLDSNAEWHGKRRFNLNEISRIDFGCGYQRALALSLKTLRGN